MSILRRWQTGSAALLTACLLAACGGGGGDSGGAVQCTPFAPSANTAPIPSLEPGGPAVSGNTATDGLAWLNYRRAQLGISVLARSALIDSAALNHSGYQLVNNLTTHDEVMGKCSFTGATALERLQHVGYTFSSNASYAYGEVISASASSSGQYLAEELITAIYHRFVIFEPMFKEMGAGSTNTVAGYYYFTTNFASNDGFGPGIGAGQIVTWPVNSQTGVTPNFFSDFEAPDPVDGINEVGYPVSVHANITETVKVNTFTIAPHGGSNLNVKLLVNSATDEHTPTSAAAIVPLTVLAAATTYDVRFSGTVNGFPVNKAWSFTTKP